MCLHDFLAAFGGTSISGLLLLPEHDAVKILLTDPAISVAVELLYHACHLLGGGIDAELFCNLHT